MTLEDDGRRDTKSAMHSIQDSCTFDDATAHQRHRNDSENAPNVRGSFAVHAWGNPSLLFVEV